MRKNHPDKWNMLLTWDSDSPTKFKPDATVHDLELRFQLEEKFLALGKSITNKEFYQTLKAIERTGDNEESKV